MAVLAALAALAGGSSAATNANDTLTVAIQDDVRSWDPANLTLGSSSLLGDAPYDFLIHEKPDGTYEGRAAESYSYNKSRTVLTLRLRKGMKFTNGDPVNAAAVKATMLRSIAAKGSSSTYLASVRRVATVGDLTVKVTLKAPDPGFIHDLTDVGGVIGDPKTFNSPDIATHPVGSGPYVLDLGSSTPGSTYTLHRNESYWDKKSYPYETVVVKVISDPSAALNALRTGQIDWSAIPSNFVSAAKSAGLFVTARINTVGSIYFADRGGEKIPALRSLAVRQAINYALDRQSMVKYTLHGFGKPTNQLFPSFLPAYDPKLAHAYDYNQAKAKSLMKKSGFASGFSVTMPSYPQIVPLEPVIQQNLAAIGVKVTWENVPAGQQFSLMAQGKYPMFFAFAGTEGTPHDVAVNVAPNALLNPFHSSNATVAKLLHNIQYAQSDAAQAAAYKALGSYLVKQAWFAPILVNYAIYASRTTTHFSSGGQNIHVSPANFRPAKG